MSSESYLPLSYQATSASDGEADVALLRSEPEKSSLFGKSSTSTLSKTSLFLIIVASAVVAGVASGTLVYFGRSCSNSAPSASSSPSSAAWAQSFLTIPKNTSVRQYLLDLTSRPHLAGTAGDSWTASYVADSFHSAGLSVTNYTFDVYLPFPVTASLRALPPFSFQAVLKEEAFPQDPSTEDPNVTPTFNGYSISGNVTGELVYVNYGTTDDFALLSTMNISVVGRIVLTRYGAIYRGDKVANAAQAGAIGCLIYSDPASFAPVGTAPNQVYPFTQWLPSQGVQRGSIFEGFGDPLTPGWPAVLPGTAGERIAVNDSRALLPKIVTQPISYGDALPLLQALNGTVAPANWQGGLPITYHIGPGPITMELVVQSNNSIATITNVCATVPGAVEPDRVVLLGNHRDAWVFGAVDPNSGTSSMLEVARGYGQLQRQGWAPRRTLMLCSWDAEEAGTIGSTEWVERNRDMLSAQLVTYINVDSSVSGPNLAVACMPSLDDIILSTSRQVPGPADTLDATLYDNWVRTSGGQAPTLDRLGDCSSDYCAFVGHLGATSADMRFIGEDGDSSYPVYHSMYDDFRWMELFGDPGFHRHTSMAQMWGLLAMNIADSPVLPYNYTGYAQEILSYIGDTDTMLRNANAPPRISTAPLYTAQQAFLAAAVSIDALTSSANAAAGSNTLASTVLSQRLLSDRLQLAERGMLSLGGLIGPAEDPTRAWYRHMVYAPAAHDVYSTTRFPGVVDAVYWAVRGDDTRWDEVQHQLWEVARAVERAAVALGGVYY